MRHDRGMIRSGFRRRPGFPRAQTGACSREIVACPRDPFSKSTVTIPPKAAHLLAGKIMLRMRFEPGITGPTSHAAVPQASARFPARWSNAVPFATPAFSTRAWPENCRTARRSRRLSFGEMRSDRASSLFSPTTMTPPTISECPFRYFVAEWTTMSKPSLNRPLNPWASQMCYRKH